MTSSEQPPEQSEDSAAERTAQQRVQSTFRQVVDEGVDRLERTWPALLATGFVGGVDVSFGVFALLIVEDATGSKMLGALAFSIGFVALTLAHSELFTENFLVPLAAIVARKEGVEALARLWGGTAAMNLVGGWLVAAIVVVGFPDLREGAVELGAHFPELGIGWRSFATGMLGGAIITLMTWMIEGTASQGAKITASVIAGFLYPAAEINHCIVASLEMFAGLIVGAPYGYLDWLAMFSWAVLGNMVGGIGLITLLRFVQVGGGQVREEQFRQAEVRREQVRGDSAGTTDRRRL